MKNELSESVMLSALSTTWIGRSYHYLDSVDSTNELLKKRIHAGDTINPAAGTVLLTNYQSQGRGRLQRRWDAPPGTSLLFSVLLRPAWPAPQLPWLTMIAGLAVCRAIERQTGLEVGLKWPNDVLIMHDKLWRKVCGILLEGHIAAQGQLEYAILGIGINVNIARDALPDATQPATSLMVAGGRPFDRLPLLISILKQLETAYEAADRGFSPQTQWNERLLTLGRRVEISGFGREDSLVGTAESTDTWGQLLVRDDEGRLHTIAAGDATLRDAA